MTSQKEQGPAVDGRPISKGIREAENALLAMATSGIRAELEGRASQVDKDGREKGLDPSVRLKTLKPQAKEAVPSGSHISSGGEAERARAERAMRRRWGMEPAPENEEPTEGLTKKISPSVRPSTWLDMRALGIRLERLGDQTSLNALTDRAISVMVAEMNAGLDGRVEPDAYDVASEALELLRACRKGKGWNPDLDQALERLEAKMDEL